MLGTPDVTVFPQTTAAGASYRVVINVLRFDSVPGEAATLDAVWTVRQAKVDQSQYGPNRRSVCRRRAAAMPHSSLLTASRWSA